VLRFLSTRLWNGALVMIGVSFVSFLLFNYIGDPVNNLLGERATVEQREAMRATLGLDKPLVCASCAISDSPRAANSASRIATWSR
jgi:peptide/nickel transport system permease protein